MSSFNGVWHEIRQRLSRGMEIRNWGYDRGYTGNASQIVDVNYDEIVVTGEKTNGKRRIARRDFEKVFEVWDRYRVGLLPRDAVTKISRNSTYIFSILHWLEDASDGTSLT